MGSLEWEDPAQSFLGHICPILPPKWLNSNNKVGLLNEPSGDKWSHPSGKRVRIEI